MLGANGQGLDKGATANFLLARLGEFGKSAIHKTAVSDEKLILVAMLPHFRGELVKPAAPAAGKSDPNVMALQQKLIAAGAKIKADGIMGPATRAAQAQFPNVTTQTDAEKAVAADINSADKTPATPTPAPAPAAPAAPAGMQAVADDDGNTTITRPDGSTMVVGPDGKQIMPGSNPNLPQNKGFLNTLSNKVQGKGEFQQPTGFIPAVKESAYDELQRIVSLIHHR